MEEMFDIYDINGNHLGIKPKSFCHGENPGVYHKPVWIWIVSDNGKILLQKRAKTKKFMPSLWDAPSAGHVSAGEELKLACVRETEEELGLITKPEDFIFLKEVLSQKVWELGQVYLLKIKHTNNFVLQQEEVEQVKWFGLEAFKDLLYSDNFVPYDKEYKDWIFGELKSQIKDNQTLLS